MPGPGFRTLRPGRISYRAGLDLQERLVSRRLHEEEDILVLLEHLPVVTLGRGAMEKNVLASKEDLAARGVDLVRVGRGGDVTYHGPGQLVCYPIVDLNTLGRDVHRFLRMLESVIIEALGSYAMTAQRLPEKTGVWVHGRKIASIGIGVRRWISWHGFALNISGDLAGFSHVVPCGIPEVSMTSLETEMGRPLCLADVERRIIDSFGRIFSSRYAGEYEKEL